MGVRTLLSGWGGSVLALAAGVLASFGFAPYAWRWALWLGIGLWLVTLYFATVPQTRRRGLLFGLGYFGFGVYWVYYSIHYFAGVPLLLSVGLAGLLVLYLSLYPMLAAWLAACGSPNNPARVVAAAVWLGLLEWVRGVALGGFPWVTVGQGVLDSSWAGWLPVVGVYGAGLLLLLSIALAVNWLMRPRSWHALGLVGVIGMISAGIWLQERPWTEPSGPPQLAALVQPNTTPDRHWRRGHLEVIKAGYRNMTANVSQVPLIIWPEAAIPQLFEDDPAFYTHVMNEIVGAGSTLVIGAFFKEHESSPSTGMINLRNGQRYRKRQLVPFGESEPLPSILAPLYRLMHIPMNRLTPSKDHPVIEIENNKVGLSICYESIFPEITRLAGAEAGYLLNLSNDSWFGPSRAPFQHLEAARLRAAESGREMLRATTNGVTALIGADGSLQQTLPQFKEGYLIREVRPRKGMTPYTEYGDGPFFILSILLLLAVSFVWRRLR